jgi:3'-phosphoadenosine 5'-phosphosulfate sulfotransferase (PAPS reductase)/FAD synthetase
MAEYIARISYGKDSLKMLDVIWTRGLPLDRITTTYVWATDTISANLPEMDAFKAKMDKRIKELYGIEVEHLCARNPDGSKKTYEQMFYHVPVRRSQIGNVEREREPVPNR